MSLLRALRLWRLGPGGALQSQAVGRADRSLTALPPLTGKPETSLFSYGTLLDWGRRKDTRRCKSSKVSKSHTPNGTNFTISDQQYPYCF